MRVHYSQITQCWPSYRSGSLRVKQQRAQNTTTSITDLWNKAAHMDRSLVGSAACPALATITGTWLFPIRRWEIPLLPSSLSKLFLGTKAANSTLLGWNWPIAAAPSCQTSWIAKLAEHPPKPSLAKSVICQVQITWHLQVQVLYFGLIWKSRGRNSRQANMLLNDQSHNWGLGGKETDQPTPNCTE